MADELRLKVSAADYMQKIAMLDNKIDALRSISSEYNTLKNDSVNVLGEGDSNLSSLQNAVDKNIKAVEGQLALLDESRQMLQRQMENLDELKDNVSQMFENTIETAKTAFNTVKAVGDLVN